MRDLTRKTIWLVTVSLIPALGACSNDGGDSLTGPGNGGHGGSVSLSVAVPGAGNGSFSAGGALFEVVQSVGGDELVISSVTLVLREVELERQFDDDCDDHVSGENDDCEEFSSGPMLLPLPLDGSVDQVVTIQNVPADTYDEVEFEIHKPDDDTPEDTQFIFANPDFADVSIRAEGTFNGDSFVYLSDLNEDQEHALVPPLVVNESSTTVNLTLSIDITTWFVTGDGSLVDPTSANKGGPNENAVRDNIRGSIDIFGDDDLDGEDDELEDDS